MNKTVFTMLAIISTIFISTAAYAETITKEMSDLTRVLLNNSTVSEKLKSNCADKLISYNVSQVESGVQKFELTFAQSGNCFPVKAQVTIIEDMNPTYADASPEYQATVQISPQ